MKENDVAVIILTGCPRSCSSSPWAENSQLMHKRIATQEWTKPGVSTTSHTSTSTRGRYQYQQVPAHAHVIVPVPSGRSTCWTTKSFCCWNQIVSISKGILHVFFLSDCYQHQFLETQIQQIFWRDPYFGQFCNFATHWVALVLLSSRSVAFVIGFGRSSNSVLYLRVVFLMLVGRQKLGGFESVWWCPRFWPNQLCPVFGQSLKECVETLTLGRIEASSWARSWASPLWTCSSPRATSCGWTVIWSGCSTPPPEIWDWKDGGMVTSC